MRPDSIDWQVIPQWQLAGLKAPNLYSNIASPEGSRMYRSLICVLVSILAAPLGTTIAQEPKEKSKTDKPLTPAEEYRAIMRDLQGWLLAATQAKTDEERKKLADAFEKKGADPGLKLLNLAERHPKDPV